MRGLVRLVGKYTRYYFLKLIGRPKKIEAFSNEYKDDYEDMGNAISQDLINVIVGICIFALLSIVIVYFTT